MKIGHRLILPGRSHSLRFQRGGRADCSLGLAIEEGCDRSRWRADRDMATNLASHARSCSLEDDDCNRTCRVQHSGAALSGGAIV
jgi:hypothetical protein